MALSNNDVEDVLRKLIDPNVGTDLITAKAVKQITIDGNAITLRVRLGYPARSFWPELTKSICESLTAAFPSASVTVDLGTEIVSHAVQKNLSPLPGARNIIAIASGKGGVGKSTTAVNLALALAAEGARTGLLDADIYGPSQPVMLGVTERPQTDGKSFTPVQALGLQTMSIGYLIDEDTPMIWRGPMVTGALQQLLKDTRWDDLDYLIIDLPPGTGDIQLTLAQQIPVSGAVIVTTPQDIALLDAQKGLRMFEKVGVPVLGLVENMSVHICSQCGHAEPIFGTGGGYRMAERYGVELLGALPLDIRIREAADGGRPSVISDPDGTAAHAYKSIARKLAARLALKARDYSGRFPTITVVNS